MGQEYLKKRVRESWVSRAGDEGDGAVHGGRSLDRGMGQGMRKQRPTAMRCWECYTWTSGSR